MEKVSVIVINWNGEYYLERCLAALTAQTVMPYEIILVDNASSDASMAIAKKFPDLKIIALNHNCGFAGGNNLAINSASQDSEWIAFINPDAFATPSWLEELLSSAKRNPTYTLFGSQLLSSSEPNLLDGAGDAYHISGRMWRIGHGEPAVSYAPVEREVFSPCAAAAMCRRGALLEVGGFDEDYFCYVEDVDLGFRLRLAGYRCLYVPLSVAHHVGSGTTGGQHSDFAVYHGHRNLVWTYVKDMPGMLFWVFLPLHLAMNLVAMMVFTVRGQGGVMFRAKRDALMGIPRMWRKRRQIQCKRVVSWRAILRVLEKGFGK